METKPALVIGVICNGFNQSDINYYSNEFRLINNIFGERVRLLFIGYSVNKKRWWQKELPPETEYTKPVSIIHWFKHLSLIKIDLLFTPLIPGIYNETSENIHKWMEMGLFGVPLITVDMYPYNNVITDKINGFLYESRETFIAYLRDLLENRFTSVKMCGLNAYEVVKMNHCR
jgi:hypothetical protein